MDVPAGWPIVFVEGSRGSVVLMFRPSRFNDVFMVAIGAFPGLLEDHEALKDEPVTHVNISGVEFK